MRALTTLALASTFLLAAHARDASACGGGFSEYDVDGMTETFQVDSQKIALAISNERTVLWSQIKYAGEPADWAWVLPVGAGTTLELADEAWFEALDTVTSTQVRSQALSCTGGDGGDSERSGCGCGSADAAGDGGGMRNGGEFQDGGESEPATVIHAETIGPYETVTLKADSGESAKAWLEQNGYYVSPEMAPILDAYATAGMDFLAMRLKPGAGVQEMQPVRVVTPGASPLVPLAMMTAGAPPETPITLYVIGEGRYRPQNFPVVDVDTSKLTWDYASETSNYEELRAGALASQDGRGFLTSFAHRGLEQPVAGLDGAAAEFDVGGVIHDNFVDVYFAHAETLVGAAAAGRCTDMAFELVGVGGVVAECPVEGCADDEIDAQELVCEGHADVGAALVGMRPADVWVTRLEARLPKASLADDLILEPAPQSAVASWYKPTNALNVPADCHMVDYEAMAALQAPAQTKRRMPNLGLFAVASALGMVFARRSSRRRDDDQA